MNVNLLKANNGDAILISYTDEEGINRNILIDGGTPRTYKFKNQKGKLTDGDLKRKIDNIEEKGEYIDLLVVTHVDDDHIGGILEWIESNTNFNLLVKKVWFNSGSLIFEYFNSIYKINNSINLKIKQNTETSIRQGVTFETYIEEKNIWQKEVILQGKSIDIYGLSIKILTPNPSKLKLLLNKWDKESHLNLTSKKNDYKENLEQLNKKDIFIEDTAVHNGSSISFIIGYKNKKLLFLADAHPSDVISGLEYWGYNKENKLFAEIVKISHHGSNKNTSYKLLSYIESNLYLISSNGDIHNLPDKQCLARIINANPGVHIGFNYPEKIKKIFLDEDHKQFKFSTNEFVNLEL